MLARLWTPTSDHAGRLRQEGGCRGTKAGGGEEGKTGAEQLRSGSCETEAEVEEKIGDVPIAFRKGVWSSLLLLLFGPGSGRTPDGPTEGVSKVAA